MRQHFNIHSTQTAISATYIKIEEPSRSLHNIFGRFHERQTGNIGCGLMVLLQGLDGIKGRQNGLAKGRCQSTRQRILGSFDPRLFDNNCTCGCCVAATSHWKAFFQRFGRIQNIGAVVSVVTVAAIGSTVGVVLSSAASTTSSDSFSVERHQRRIGDSNSSGTSNCVDQGEQYTPAKNHSFPGGHHVNCLALLVCGS